MEKWSGQRSGVRSLRVVCWYWIWSFLFYFNLQPFSIWTWRSKPLSQGWIWSLNVTSLSVNWARVWTPPNSGRSVKNSAVNAFINTEGCSRDSDIYWCVWMSVPASPGYSSHHPPQLRASCISVIFYTSPLSIPIPMYSFPLSLPLFRLSSYHIWLVIWPLSPDWSPYSSLSLLECFSCHHSYLWKSRFWPHYLWWFSVPTKKLGFWQNLKPFTICLPLPLPSVLLLFSHWTTGSDPLSGFLTQVLQSSLIKWATIVDYFIRLRIHSDKFSTVLGT